MKEKDFRIPFITKKQLKSRQALHIILLRPQYKVYGGASTSILTHPFLMFPLFQKCLNPKVRTSKWYSTVLFTTVVLQD